MADPIVIPLSAHQVARLAAFEADGKRLQERLSDTVTAFIAGHVDPATVATWAIRQDGASIVCTPPTAPDIAPSGANGT